MKARRALAAVVLATLAACGRQAPPPAPAPVPPSSSVATPPPQPPAPPRLEHVELPLSRAFQEAVRSGTRTLDGRPGPRYWQQRVDYTIDAQLNPKTAVLQGEETIRYVNNSPDTLPQLVLHLYQNLFKPGVARAEPVPVTTGMTIERVTVGGRELRELKQDASTPGYQIDGTLMALRLPKAVQPGDTATLQIAWHFTVPPGEAAPRMKHIGQQLFLIAQWYPQVAVYDDVNGWHMGQYLATGEFYLEYGNFDVSITMPEGYVIGATGELQNADEVLTDDARRRLAAAARTDEVVHVVDGDDLASRNATQRVPGGELTWRFRARNVRDFAFAASNRYLWDATRAILPRSTGASDTIVVHALYRPEATQWREAARYSRHSVEFHSKSWYRYIYPQITSAEGPEGGMEYPMIVFVRAYSEPVDLYDVITHEIGHEWFPMMVGSNEREYAWQDEGVNTYIEQFAVKDLFPTYTPFESDVERYLRVAGDGEAEMMRPADLFPSGLAYAVGAYSKPALALRVLSQIVGEETIRNALREYTNRWLLKHPMPYDFFRTVSSVAGRDLDWFFRPWWFTTQTLDFAVDSVATRTVGSETSGVITIRNRGGLPAPVDVAVTAGAETRRITIPADAWLAGAVRIENVPVAGTVQRVVIDPEGKLPETDRRNNAWGQP